MGKSTERTSGTETAAFFSLIRHPVKFRLYLLKNLPAGYFSGLRIVAATETACTVSVPYNWFTKNPFRSTYFACLSMAAEMSTGVLAMAHLYKKKPAVSMLVTGVEGRFYKKADGLSLFDCRDGEEIRNAIEAAVSSAAAQEVKARAVGRNKKGETIAEFWITWSFKVKTPRT